MHWHLCSYKILILKIDENHIGKKLIFFHSFFFTPAVVGVGGSVEGRRRPDNRRVRGAAIGADRPLLLRLSR